MVNDQLHGQPGFDRLFPLKPLQDDILTVCRTNYHPHKNLSVDERMVATKARIGMKQYMKDKPTKWGYKLFVQQEWGDVALCSTIHKAYSGESAQRRVHNPDKSWSRKVFPVPDPIKEYNKYMGGWTLLLEQLAKVGREPEPEPDHRSHTPEHRAQSTEHTAQSTEHRTHTPEHRAQSTEHRAGELEHLS